MSPLSHPRRVPSSRHARPRCRPEVERLETLRLMASNVVLRWNDVALDAVATDSLPGHGDQAGPTRTARALAIVQLAVFDAVNAIDRQYTPYLLRKQFPRWASIDAAVAQAAHDTLVSLYPKQKHKFDDALGAELDDVADGRGETLGKYVGRRAADRILNDRANDGSQRMMSYRAPVRPGTYLSYPGEPDAVTPQWGQVRPFALRSARQFVMAPPPALTSVAYAQAYNEVKSLGGDGVTTPTERTAQQTIIGKFWGYDGAPGLGTPPRLYNQITQVIAKQEDMSTSEDARLLALVNMAMADAGIACWDCKYTFDFWRPIRGIRQVGPNGEDLDDGNPRTEADPTFTPLGAPYTNGDVGHGNFTPPFPAYTSGHATFGAAMFQTLRRVVGRDQMTFTIISDEYNGQNRDVDGSMRPLIPRTYRSFSQAMEENGQSRIYLGIHWAFDKTIGIKNGRQIANFAFANHLRPI